MFVAFAEVFTLVVFPALGVYQSWRGRSMPQLVGRVTLAWLLIQACGVLVMFSFHESAAVSRLWFFYWSALTACALIGSRVAAYATLARMRYAGLNQRRVAIVGWGEHGAQVLHNVAASPASGFRTVSVFDPRPGLFNGVALGGLAAFDDMGAFAKHVREEGVGEVWLALPLSEESLIHRCINEFRGDLVNIRLIPDVRTLAVLNSRTIDLIGAPAINLVASPLSSNALLQKEMFDRTFAALALIALAPLFLVIAIAVKLSSRGPVFFTQRRKGADGRVFKIYKFRSMRLHAETQGVVSQAKRHDSRITRVGAFLRQTSLDELPQFFNVLRGEMSVVGPRPHALEHDDLYAPIVEGYIHRYRIKPGITGWAQVNGFRGETERVEKMQKRVDHDLYYLRNWSFALDMRIILATIVRGFVNRNAY
jgi:Undecaprenyl-phosphate glucose phosphotransferase